MYTYSCQLLLPVLYPLELRKKVEKALDKRKSLKISSTQTRRYQLYLSLRQMGPFTLAAIQFTVNKVAEVKVYLLLHSQASDIFKIIPENTL